MKMALDQHMVKGNKIKETQGYAFLAKIVIKVFILQREISQSFS